MRRQISMMIAIVTLGGCAFQQDAPSYRQSGYPDRYCSDVARQRVTDALANDVDPAVEPRIFSDTYASCISQKRQTSAP